MQQRFDKTMETLDEVTVRDKKFEKKKIRAQEKVHRRLHGCDAKVDEVKKSGDDNIRGLMVAKNMLKAKHMVKP